MAGTQRAKRLVLAFNKQGKRQSAFNTAMPGTALNAAFPLATAAVPTIRKTRTDQRDCRNEHLVSSEVTSRIASYATPFAATAQLLAVVAAFGFGTAALGNTASALKEHLIKRDKTSDQPPQSTFAAGFEEDATAPRIYRSMVLNDWSVKGAVRGQVDGAANWFGSADKQPAPNGYDLPDCALDRAIQTKDCALLINGVDYTEKLRDFEYGYTNNLMVNDDPFPFDAIDVVRLEKGEQTPSNFKFGVYGSEGDALYTLAESEPENVSVSLRIGAETAEHIFILAPKCKLKLAEVPIQFGGEANRTYMQLEVDPLFDFTNAANSPDTIQAWLNQAAALLAAA